MSAKVSILSAVRDEAAHVSEMIASVQAQEHQDWELLFVDDGSTDPTRVIIEAACADDVRIRLVNGHTEGKASAFNAAFAASTGDVVALLAGDDRIPAGSLGLRAETVAAMPSTPSVAYFKLRTFSDEPGFDEMVLPRGPAGSRSGGCLTMNRALAELLFPIDGTLPSEDIWLGYGSEHLAQAVSDHPDVVLEYRIHSGNSNPRHLPYPQMSASLHARHRAWLSLADSDLPLSAEDREHLHALWRAEQARHEGRVVDVLRTQGLPMIQRLGLASHAHPTLRAFRNRFYSFFSGRQGR